MKKSALSSILIAVALLAVGVTTEAQQEAKVARIGFLSIGTAPSRGLGKVKQELRALGYVEGKNIAFESRYANRKRARFPALVDELVRLNVDVILSPGTPGTLAAKNATKTIPIVFYFVGDPVGAGLVDSLPRPGGNITGFTSMTPVLAGKRLELIKEIIPKLSRVALLWNPQDRSSAQQWKESLLPARELGLQLYSMEVSRADKYESAFEAAAKARNGALVATLHGLANSQQKRIIALAAKNRLSAIYGRRDYVENGGLMSYGANNAEPYRRAAYYVDRILKGAKPADLPVEQPTKFEFIVNLKTAKQIGVTIPQWTLMKADRVIK